MKTQLSFCVALLLSAVAHLATADESCRSITASDNDVITVDSALHHPTHLILPEKIVKDVPGDTKIWAFAAFENHYWIKPGDKETDDGASTNLTIITASRSYDFRVVRVPAGRSDTCIRIDDAPAFGSGGVQPAVTAPPAAVAANTLPAFTRYAFKTPLLDSVFDDGRHTYLRLADRPDGAAIPTLSGGSVKHPELLNAEYDAASRTYSVAGIYDSLVLTANGRAYPITRERSP